MQRVKQWRNEEVLKNLGKRIREIRQSKNLSQEELANLCDVDISQINRIELGKINTGISHVFLIAEKLNVEPIELLKFK